jgi:hypothetical protein
MAKLEVPEDFARIGYSGLFHHVCIFPDTTTREGWRAKAPCLLSQGWMLLEINDAGEGVVVRRDSDAVVEALTGRGV